MPAACVCIVLTRPGAEQQLLGSKREPGVPTVFMTHDTDRRGSVVTLVSTRPSEYKKKNFPVLRIIDWCSDLCAKAG